MPGYGNEPESRGLSGEVVFAALVFVAAIFTQYLSEGSQQTIGGALQATALRPFIATQELLTEGRARQEQVSALQADLDSLSAVLSTHSALVDENRTLRELLRLAERAGPEYLPATVLRPGTPGSESMFLVDVGAEDGVQQGAAVVSPHGLIGVIREVRPRDAVGMDWTHPAFRASAMVADGSVYGLVENRPGRFREEDRLVLNGVPFNEEVAIAASVVTSGLGGTVPRGIPIGRVEAQADEEGSWRKSFWLTPMVEAGSATHVLVVRSDPDADESLSWPRDSIPAGVDSATGSLARVRDPGGPGR